MVVPYLVLVYTIRLVYILFWLLYIMLILSRSCLCTKIIVIMLSGYPRRFVLLFVFTGYFAWCLYIWYVAFLVIVLMGSATFCVLCHMDHHRDNIRGVHGSIVGLMHLFYIGDILYSYIILLSYQILNKY